MKIIWGGLFKIPPMPEFLDGAWTVFGRPFPVYNVFVIAVGLVVAVVLWATFEKTWWGKIVRATAADREMASAIGINVPRVFSGVFVVGAMLAALGGAIGTPVRVAAPGIGSAMIIQAFIITVIGGLGNLKGAFVSSLDRGHPERLRHAVLSRVRAVLHFRDHGGRPADPPAGSLRPLKP